ncbi:MAG: hypothetical protein J6V80_05395 [Clostridia bacterium]|nr:hypothetical protein [Clostridia bacterium]
MNEKYAQIINLPHHTSLSRPKMSKSDRAAQFAPYSALSGYEDAVEETARLTDRRIELDEYEVERINQSLTDLLSSPPDTRAAITYFRPDPKKGGGAYVTVVDEIGKINEAAREITLISGTTIKIDDILSLDVLGKQGFNMF